MNWSSGVYASPRKSQHRPFHRIWLRATSRVVPRLIRFDHPKLLDWPSVFPIMQRSMMMVSRKDSVAKNRPHPSALTGVSSWDVDTSSSRPGRGRAIMMGSLRFAACRCIEATGCSYIYAARNKQLRGSRARNISSWRLLPDAEDGAGEHKERTQQQAIGKNISVMDSAKMV